MSSFKNYLRAMDLEYGSRQRGLVDLAEMFAACREVFHTQFMDER